MNNPVIAGAAGRSAGTAHQSIPAGAPAGEPAAAAAIPACTRGGMGAATVIGV